MKRNTYGLIALLPLLASSAACVEFDSPAEVKDLRILAMRLDPPEVVYSPFLAMPAADRPQIPLPPAEVEATVLAVDPTTDEPITFTSHFCPTSDDVLCYDYRLPQTFDDERDPADLRLALEPLVERRDVTLAAKDGFGTRLGEVRAFAFNERAIEYVLPHDESGAAMVFFESWARIVVQAESQGVHELAYRRLPFNVNFDFSFLPDEVGVEVTQQFSEYLGLDICAPERYQEEAPDCLKPRRVNANPVVEQMRYSLEGEKPDYDEAGRDTLEAGQVFEGAIAMKPGETVNLWPVFVDDVREPYQMFEIDMQDMTIQIGNYKEDMAVSWYATRLGLGATLSELKINKGYHTSFTYPENDPPESVQVYMVTRDQRGGVTWAVVELERDDS